MKTSVLLLLLSVAASAQSAHPYYEFLNRFTQGQGNVTVVRTVAGTPDTVEMWSTVIIELGRGHGSKLKVWSKDWSKREYLPTESWPLVVEAEEANGLSVGKMAFCENRIGGRVNAIWANPMRAVFVVQGRGGARLAEKCAGVQP
jgi:hypothetical protein